MLICHAADVQAAERARPAAQRQPPVDALPVEGVAARQPPYVLPVAEPRYAHAAAAECTTTTPPELEPERAAERSATTCPIVVTIYLSIF